MQTRVEVAAPNSVIPQQNWDPSIEKNPKNALPQEPWIQEEYEVWGMVWKRTKELFVLSEIYNTKAILKSLYCLGFQDDGCLPRDPFIPKQESDERK